MGTYFMTFDYQHLFSDKLTQQNYFMKVKFLQNKNIGV